MRSWEFGHAKGNYVRAFGASNTATGPPMQQTFYQSIGSITKTFTVTAVLQLVDQGKVSLTDPISKYVAGVPDGDHITIRELARMQSGLFNYFDDQRFLESLFANPYQEWSPDQLLQIAFRHPPNFAPGTDFEYNNTNLCSWVLWSKRWRGSHWPVTSNNVYSKPLHLDHTAFPGGNQLLARSSHSGVHTYRAVKSITAVERDRLGICRTRGSRRHVFNLNDMHIWAPALATGHTSQAVYAGPAPPDGAVEGLSGLVRMASASKRSPAGWVISETCPATTPSSSTSSFSDRPHWSYSQTSINRRIWQTSRLVVLGNAGHQDHQPK